MMNTNNYITATSRTDGDDEHYKAVADRMASCARLIHYTDGLVTEAAELKDAIKKHTAYGTELDVPNRKEELGDVFWYAARIMDMFDWSMGDVMQLNIDKLKARYPEKFTQELAENRDLEKEREILEQ